MRWTNQNSSVSLELWRGDARIATSRRLNTLNNGFVDVPLTGGVSYQLRVLGDDAGLPPFTVTLSRTN